MKKLIILIMASLFSFSMASAEVGVNVGVSGQMGGFAASATESAGEKDSASENLAVGWASLFIEKELGDKAFIGVDYVPMALESETNESVRQQISSSQTRVSKTQKVQVDFTNFATIYLGLNLTDNLYAKVGYMSVDIETNESLGTGSRYGDTDMQGTSASVGYNADLDNGMFVRVEGTYMTFDGVSLTAENNTENKITLNNLDGASAKLSIGKSF